MGTRWIASLLDSGRDARDSGLLKLLDFSNFRCWVAAFLVEEKKVYRGMGLGTAVGGFGMRMRLLGELE
ncbi:hypothetical protein KY289_017346 [Solanum tuberosum]|nr:hypothetical protein KY289_017346 [Solanum tuberosum]